MQNCFSTNNGIGNTKGCIKDQNFQSLHRDLRHSNVKRYELAFILVYADPKPTETVSPYILTTVVHIS